MSDLPLFETVQGDAIKALESEVERLRTELAELKQERDRLRDIYYASSELFEVAQLRGDNELPHPADDPLLWTARMQEAWNELECALHEQDKCEEA